MTNEQRAHDIAILCVHALVRQPAISADDRIDVYTRYLEAYRIALEAVDRDFGAG